MPSVLGATPREHFAAIPDVPTLIEDGMRNVEAAFWTDLAAPAGTPARPSIRLD